jgi:hypothetical protein
MRPLLFITLLSTFLFADISVFISHNNKLTKVSNKDLANLYLKKSTTINGIKVVPIDSKNKRLFNEFYKKIVKKTPKQLHAYWVKQIYTGHTQPPKKLSKSELNKAMKKNKHLISYDRNPTTGRILLTVK